MDPVMGIDVDFPAWLLKERLPEAKRDGSGWLLESTPQYRKASAALMAGAFLLLLPVPLAYFEGGTLSRFRLLIIAAGLGGLFLWTLIWLCDAWWTKVRLDEAGITIRRPLFAPKFLAWNEIRQVAFSRNSYAIRLEGPRDSCAVSIFRNGLGRLRRYLEQNGAEASRQLGTGFDPFYFLPKLPS
jgi:hypothetical protein